PSTPPALPTFALRDALPISPRPCPAGRARRARASPCVSGGAHRRPRHGDAALRAGGHPRRTGLPAPRQHAPRGDPRPAQAEPRLARPAGVPDPAAAHHAADHRRRGNPAGLLRPVLRQHRPPRAGHRPPAGQGTPRDGGGPRPQPRGLRRPAAHRPRHRPGRQWPQPVALYSVLRGAMSRILEYRRIDLKSIAKVNVKGISVEPVIHAAAELLDNATRYSPPQTKVHVTATEVQTGVAIEIEDAGVSLDEEA